MKKLPLLFFFLSIGFASTLFAENLAPIRVGAAYALTGWAAIGGISELNATRMAVDEINNSGGVRNRKIELIVEDIQSDFKKTAGAIQKLTTIDKVPVILGPNWAEFSDVAAPLCEKNKTVMLTASGYSPTLTKDRVFIFSAIPSHALITEPFSKYIADKKHKKIAMAVTVSAYFESLESAIKSQLGESGVVVSEISKWNPGTTDFKSYITKLKSSGYDAVVLLLGEGGDLLSFLKQAKDLDYSGAKYSSNAILYDHIIENSPQLKEGVVYFEYKTRAPESFLKSFEKKYGDFASHSVPRAYDNVYVLKDAIERCKDVNAEGLKDCLHKTDFMGVSGRVRFSEHGNIIPEGPQSDLFIFNNGTQIRLN